MLQSQLENKAKEVLEISKVIEKYGCYFLSLLSALLGREPKFDEIIDKYIVFNKLGYMDSECTILYPCEIIHHYYGSRWSISKPNNEWPKEYDSTADIAIAKWHNPNTGLSHFVLMKNENEVKWDSLGDSKTVKEGYIESWRLFKLV